MNPRFSADVRTQLESDSYESKTSVVAKTGKSQFDQALERAVPQKAAAPVAKKPEPVRASARPAKADKPSVEAAHSDDADTIRARQIAATIQLAVPSILPAPVAQPMAGLAQKSFNSTHGAENEGIAPVGPELAANTDAAKVDAERTTDAVDSDDEATKVDDTSKYADVESDGVSMEDMDAVDEAAAPQHDVAATLQVAVHVAAPEVQSTDSDSHSHDSRSEQNRIDDIASLIGSSSRAADPSRAVEPVTATREVEWKGLADKVADVASGSIEGNRARVVLGEGENRVVMTVSMHAHRVAIEVETNTKAGSALADALRHQPEELRQALGQHGLELANGRSSESQQEAPEERVPRIAATSSATNTTTPELRPTGVVLA